MKQVIIKSIGAFINMTALVAPRWSTNYAFNLLCTVRRAGISEKGKAFFKEAIQHKLYVDQAESILHQWGNGPKKILFLHGWESNSQRWIPYYNLIKKENYTVYALDAPGHGMSQGNKLNIEVFRQAIEAAITHIGEIDTIIGHSLSNTALTYMYIMDTQKPIKKFIVMGAASGMDAVFVYFKSLLGLSKKSMKNLSVKVNTVLKIPHDEVKLTYFLEKVTQPMLVIHDERDAITPFAPIKKALEKNTNIASYITTGLKHDLKGEDVYKRVINFIDAS